MTSLKGDIFNRVKRLPKPSKPSEALQPLFEAVSNAMHAVEDKFEAAANNNGNINVTISNLSDVDNVEFVVDDNGVGLEPDRFVAFCTTDTAYKIDRGGKGIGRLLWLDAYNNISVSSLYSEGSNLFKREFDFVLAEENQICNEKNEPLIDKAITTGTYIKLKGLRGEAYRTKFPSRAATLIRHFGSHFFADFIMGKSPRVTLAVDDEVANFPADIQDLCIENRGDVTFQDSEFGKLTISCFICKKEASSDFEGNHQLHFVANNRTVLTRKIDGLLGVSRLGDKKDQVLHCCVTGEYLDDRVNQERTQFNFDEEIIEAISKVCAETARAKVINEEVETFDKGRLETMNDFLADYPSFHFEDAIDLLKKTPKNAVKPEQFAQALVPTRIRRDNRRKELINDVLKALDTGQDIGDDIAAAIHKAADEVKKEEQRQLTEYVLRRKIVLDVMEVLIRRVRNLGEGETDFHLESTLHEFICPMRVRGDNPAKIESVGHDLWIIDERLAFSQYFASDVPFKNILADSDNGDKPDVLIYDKLHGMGFKDDEPLKRVILVEFKKPGRKSYSERYSPQNQVSRYLHELKDGKIESFNGERVRVADDCVFHCYVVADIVGNLDVQTGTWRTTSNGRGRWTELSGKYRGSIEIIEWKDLLTDARLRNRAFFQEAGV